ncbi:hypothetical protein BH10BAC2_BH10BAC2_39910 [soil metagenome]
MDERLFVAGHLLFIASLVASHTCTLGLYATGEYAYYSILFANQSSARRFKNSSFFLRETSTVVPSESKTVPPSPLE